MKKILILTVTAGNGHNSCAAHMKNKLESLGECEVKIIDILKSYSSKLNAWISDTGYALTVGRLLSAYNSFYNRYMKAEPCRRYSCPSQSTVVTTLDGLLREITAFKPDVIYATHFYGAIALTDLKLLYDLPCKAVSTCLDYVNSPFWESAIGIDYLNIPNGDFTEEFVREGFRNEQLISFGIPVDGRTLEKQEKSAARRSLGIGENDFTVTVMFGGGYWNGGYKIFKQAVKALKGKRAQIIVINGKNKRSFKQVAKTKTGGELKVLNVGFTQDVPLYLSASDVAVTKCGGLSSTEMINESLPMLVTEKLPAQEKYNLDYLKEKGVALSFKNGKELKAQLLRLLDNRELLEKMAESAAPLKCRALDGLAQFILSLPNADYGSLDAMKIDFNKTKKAAKAALKSADKAERKQSR